MPKILIINSCEDCCYYIIGFDQIGKELFVSNTGTCVEAKKELPTIDEIPEWCPLDDEDNKLRARWFEKGQMSVKRKNKSGCCCIIDDNDEVVSVCGAHETWMEEQCQS